ncbi:MAG: type I DNA topoisomerase [Prolixibacteraceae bacterium]|jgi:DNA topoisomerase I|nr:type I DNA topoisomerase [Prolixibacteraceae bacterium]MBT6764174.1 type I DNA topoisomerase [Prolixibacteraceae bacterium]MBT6998133.1 type I DNA topoisomerase [Prolixibacteraceae bacterium]MBT7393949.1 type I DNA topoisomerase [Prolixibacteraceae bacterium]
MQENLVIVESPAKAKTIEKFLGKGYMVTSSMGHVRDLEKKDFGIDLENKYQPKYIVSPDKKKIVAELKKLAKESKTVWLAADEDREGEAIAWHLKEVLKLKPEKTKRIVFHEITKDAITKAIENPRNLDDNLVNAQQARRVLDRIVGFKLSPVLWKKIKPSLSAGRVQSVAVRFIVEREREIMNFKSEFAYRVNGYFLVAGDDGKTTELKSELSKRFNTQEEANSFLEKCKTAKFNIEDVVKKPGKRSPAQPFTTSTLQQEASRKMGFSVSQTMAVAQRLYENGKITYMRTDSVNLSGLALNTAKQKIKDLHGDKYVKTRKYKTKAKGAQEAHEAIRPTYLNNETVDGSSQEKRLYELIWKRTIASQMADAKLERTTVSISISNTPEKFIANGEVLIFDGFLKVYIESTDDENGNNRNGQVIIPPLKVNDSLQMASVVATKRFSQRPARFTEASLVKRMEELGIGRPSTYAPTITTIQNRNYVIKEDRPGVERRFDILTLSAGKITKQNKVEITGAEKSKLFPTDIGMVVNDFLVDNFEQIMDFNFTASVEKEFDDIADGKKIWNEMIDKFYKPFHKKVEKTLKHSERSKGERILGDDPKTGKQVSVKIGRFGPLAQLGEGTANGEGEKPQFASLRVGQHLETITLDEALELFKLPRELGEFENKKVTVAIGRFGPYVRHDNKFVSLGKEDDPYVVKFDRAIELIEAKREKDRKAVINIFEEEPELKVLNGRWGPYISYKKKNYKIPKNTKAEELSLNDCLKIIKEAPEPKSKRSKKK